MVCGDRGRPAPVESETICAFPPVPSFRSAPFHRGRGRPRRAAGRRRVEPARRRGHRRPARARGPVHLAEHRLRGRHGAGRHVGDVLRPGGRSGGRFPGLRVQGHRGRSRRDGRRPERPGAVDRRGRSGRPLRPRPRGAVRRRRRQDHHLRVEGPHGRCRAPQRLGHLPVHLRPDPPGRAGRLPAGRRRDRQARHTHRRTARRRHRARGLPLPAEQRPVDGRARRCRGPGLVHVHRSAGGEQAHRHQPLAGREPGRGRRGRLRGRRPAAGPDHR